MDNCFGNILRLTTFGESHGKAVGGIVDGFPAGVQIDPDALRAAMQRRRPGQNRLTTQRNEPDDVEILSGVFEGISSGSPIAFMVRNTDMRSSDYADMKDLFRPSHADFTWHIKYGGIRDWRGGGRASARETLARVVGGELARQMLHQAVPELDVIAWTGSVGNIVCDTVPESRSQVDASDVRCPDNIASGHIIEAIDKARSQGDTLGGIVSAVVRNCPAGLGSPVFDKLQARLAAAMLSIPAAKGFEYGMGFEGTRHTGAEMADIMLPGADPRHPRFATNHSGGIQGGISNGEDILFSVAFKPVATLMREMPTVDINGEKTIVSPRGRHDVCVVPRAVPVVEAMAWLVIADAFLSSRTDRI